MTDFLCWLSDQDVSIQYLYEQLLNQQSNDELQRRIASEGYGKYLLSKQNPDGHWGKYYYQPKWTSTHYALLQLKDFRILPDNSVCREILFRMFEDCQLPEGGLNLAKSDIPSDVCVDGMILNYSSYFIPESENLKSLVLSILRKQKSDGGFTWLNQNEGDPHSTICVLEGFYSFITNTDFVDLQSDIELAIQKALDYFYQHNLFLDEKKYLKLVYPFRYFYSVFRFLILAADLNVKVNETIIEALNLLSKKEFGGFFKLEKEYKGQTFINFSEIGETEPFLTIYGKYIFDRLKNR